jgi:hypothetical protein
MITLRMTATTARTTGKDKDNSKDDDSKDNGNDSEDNYNDGGSEDRGGGGGSGGKIGGKIGGVARSMALAWLVAVFFTVGCLALTYRRKHSDKIGNNFILVKNLFGMSKHAEKNLFYSYIFQVYSMFILEYIQV